MNEIQASSNEKIEKKMGSLHPLNENLKKLLKTTKIQNEENEQKIEAPEFLTMNKCNKSTTTSDHIQ